MPLCLACRREANTNMELPVRSRMRHVDPPCDRCGRPWEADWIHEAELTDEPESEKLQYDRLFAIISYAWVGLFALTIGIVESAFSGILVAIAFGAMTWLALRYGLDDE